MYEEEKEKPGVHSSQQIKRKKKQETQSMGKISSYAAWLFNDWKQIKQNCHYWQTFSQTDKKKKKIWINKIREEKGILQWSQGILWK